jgi:hypothetical protein
VADAASAICAEFGGNDLLAQVRPDDADHLGGELETVRLNRGHVLAEGGQSQQHVYFPAGCLISVCVQLGNASGSSAARDSSVCRFCWRASRVANGSCVKSAGKPYACRRAHFAICCAVKRRFVA